VRRRGQRLRVRGGRAGPECRLGRRRGAPRRRRVVAIARGEVTPLPGAPARLGAIAVGPDGTLWVSGEGLASYDGKAWKQHALPPALRKSLVRSLVFAADGARYGVAGGVLVAGRGDTWTALTAGAPPVRDVALAGDGTIYVSRGHQVASFAHGKLVPIATVKGDSLSLVTAPDGTVHVFDLEGAHRIATGKLEPLAALPPTVAQAFGADGTLYGISADGLRIVRRRAGGAVDELTTEEELPSRIRSITVDASKRLWLVLEHGMAILDRGQLTPLMPGEVPGLSRSVEAIAVTGRGPNLRGLLDARALRLLTRLTSTLTGADQLTLHEGLPHKTDEADLVAAERRVRPVQELREYWFYQEPLAPSAEDVARLTLLLSTPATFAPFLGESMCCEFHPDFAVEWQQDSSVYRALLCFGCHEARLFGPGLAERYSLWDGDELHALLTKYRKNRPPSSRLCELLSSQFRTSTGELDWLLSKLGARNLWDQLQVARECAQRGYFR